MILGEIFPSSYKIEMAMVREFYEKYPNAGSYKILRVHAKIYAGYNESEDFYFGIQTSANINTNPRIENGCITIDKNLFGFYYDYFKNIRDEKEERKGGKE